MPFSDFHGNPDVVRRLREMLARDRFPHAVILAGPQGAGKYTLALMLARAMNCTGIARSGPADALPDFCGKCDSCRRIGDSLDLEARFAEAVEAREAMRDADKRETRIFVQTHPDVLIIPPDPPQMMIKVDQVRRVNETIRYKPGEARRSVFIFSVSAFMKEAANSLLKILEEPPEYANIFLLAQNPGELLATIRSRCAQFVLSPLPATEIEKFLSQHRPEWNARQRELIARLSGGGFGRALSLDLEQYTAARKDALAMLRAAAGATDHSELFRATETYRGGGEGKEKTDQLMIALYALLKDVTAVVSGAPELVRNTDVAAEIKSLAKTVDFEWVSHAAEQLARVQRGMRRNVLRPLSLDAFALSVEGSSLTR